MRLLGRMTQYVWAMMFSAVVAATVCALQVTILVMIGEAPPSSGSGVAQLVGLLSFVIAAPAFFLGLLLVGLPTWFVAQQRGWTRYRHAAIAGAVEATLVGALLLTPAMSFAVTILATCLPLAGAVGGMTFRWLIDDRPKPLPAQPS